MENKINIPTPCHENWNAMLPEEQGRHCLSCCKTVIDFSTWKTEDILTYLQSKKEERVCGRFKAEQVVTTEKTITKRFLFKEVIQSNISFFKKMAAMLVVCFALSYSTNAQTAKKSAPTKNAQHSKNATIGRVYMGDVAINDTTKNKKCVTIDTIQPMVVGIIAAPPVKKEKAIKSKKNKD